jgi:hypothetical protein
VTGYITHKLLHLFTDIFPLTSCLFVYILPQVYIELPVLTIIFFPLSDCLACSFIFPETPKIFTSPSHSPTPALGLNSKDCCSENLPRCPRVQLGQMHRCWTGGDQVASLIFPGFYGRRGWAWTKGWSQWSSSQWLSPASQQPECTHRPPRNALWPGWSLNVASWTYWPRQPIRARSRSAAQNIQSFKQS